MYARKRPVVVEVNQLTEDNAEELADWCGGSTKGTFEGRLKPDGIRIPTLEGLMTADLGDWIIKGVKGEFYACKPDIFAQTYEVV